MSEYSRLTAFKREVVSGQRDQEKQHYAALMKQAQDKVDDHQLRMEIGRAIESTQQTAGWPFIEAILYERLYHAADAVKSGTGDALARALAEFEMIRDVIIRIENLVKEGEDSENALHKKMKEREEKDNE